MSAARSEGRRPWTLRQRVDRATVGVLGLLILLIVVVVVALLDVKHKGDEVVERWDPAYLASQNALAATVDQETGVRGFALSGSENLLQPYDEGRTSEAAEERELDRLLAGRRDLLGLFGDFRASVASWHAEIAEPYIARVRAGDATVADDVGGAAAKASFDHIRDTSARLTDAIDGVRIRAQHSRSRAFDYVWATIGFGTAVLLGTGFLVGRGLRRSVLTPIGSLVDQTRAVAAGDLDRRIVQSGPVEIVDLGRDVDTMRARLAAQIAGIEHANQTLAERGTELARSNADLEQFAYVASHDLSEPLRKVTNFGQLLERQYGEQLDDRARQYMAYMVDGAKRMQALIGDLLEFSRVGRTTDHFQSVDLDQALAIATSNLEAAITDTGAEVTADPLPVVDGDPSLLVALLQNLVSNAVKYRDPDRPPRVEIGAERAGPMWRITVADNGIGIDPQYAERVFAIFQRLHLRDQYGGTGIGLAMCRKIAEFHGGQIRLEEHDGPGARFVLLLPELHGRIDSAEADLLDS